jgi:hypothetical protein
VQCYCCCWFAQPTNQPAAVAAAVTPLRPPPPQHTQPKAAEPAPAPVAPPAPVTPAPSLFKAPEPAKPKAPEPVKKPEVCLMCCRQQDLSGLVLQACWHAGGWYSRRKQALTRQQVQKGREVAHLLKRPLGIAVLAPQTCTHRMFYPTDKAGPTSCKTTNAPPSLHPPPPPHTPCVHAPILWCWSACLQGCGNLCCTTHPQTPR